MPSLAGNDGMEQRQIGGSTFSFTAARIKDLGATEYSLVTIAVDTTGSTIDFADGLRQALVTAVESCKS